MTIDPVFALVGAVAFFAGGVVKGASGMGMPLIAVSIMAAVGSVAEILPLMAVPTIASNIWQVRQTRYLGPGVRRFWTLILPLVVATWLGAGFIAVADSDVMHVIVGVVVVAFVGISVSRFQPNIRPGLERVLSPAVGVVGGGIGGMTGIFGPPFAMYLLALKMNKDEFVGAMGAFMLVCSVTITLALAGYGLLGTREWILSALAFLPALAGLGVGAWMRRRISPDIFRQAVLALLFVLGVSHLRSLVGL